MMSSDIQVNMFLPPDLVREVDAKQDGEIVNTKRSAFILVLRAGLRALDTERPPRKPRP